MNFITTCKAPNCSVFESCFGNFSSLFSREFLNRIITSHLQTNCSSIIISNSNDLEEIKKANILINTLMLFLSPNERDLCAHLTKDYRFIPNLLIQGIGNDFDKALTLQSLKPTTIIDISKMKVQQIITANYFQKARHLLLNYEADIAESKNPKNQEHLQEDYLFKQVKGLFFYSFLKVLTIFLFR